MLDWVTQAVDITTRVLASGEAPDVQCPRLDTAITQVSKLGGAASTFVSASSVLMAMCLVKPSP